MPFYRAHNAIDKLLPHPSPAGDWYSSPSLAFNAHFTPHVHDCIPADLVQRINGPFALYEKVTFSEFQWDSLMSLQMAEKLGADISILQEGYCRIWRFPEYGPYNVDSLECKSGYEKTA